MIYEVLIHPGWWSRDFWTINRMTPPTYPVWSPRPNKTWSLRIMYAKDSLLPRGKVWSLDFLGYLHFQPRSSHPPGEVCSWCSLVIRTATGSATCARRVRNNDARRWKNIETEKIGRRSLFWKVYDQPIFHIPGNCLSTFLGMVKWPFKWLSDLQIGGSKRSRLESLGNGIFTIHECCIFIGKSIGKSYIPMDWSVMGLATFNHQKSTLELGPEQMGQDLNCQSFFPLPQKIGQSSPGTGNRPNLA